MAYVFAEGGYGAAATVIQADSSHPDVISIPDAELLRSGTLHRIGVDLHLNGHDGQHVVIPGYFASEHPAALVGPNGGRLTADIVVQLAGREELAAAQPTTTNDATTHFDHGAIGHVDKITGDVTVVRSGVSVTLHAGDAVYKSDVIQTGNGSAVAISFADGTAVHLAANTRMVLTSFSFDSTSDSNDALFTLTDGTFAFVGGKIAHDGTIKIATEVATMRVHEGTFGWAHHLTAAEISSISARLGSVSYAFAVVNEHGANTHGIYDLLVNDGVVGNVDDPNLVSYLDSDGNLLVQYLAQQWLA
jgi:FecR protein